jgi:hypothetical protein
MPNSTDIRNLMKEIRERQERNLNKLENIRTNETPYQAEVRRLRRVSWLENMPLLECDLHIDHCVYDGSELRGVSMAEVAGDVAFGPEFRAYFLTVWEDEKYHLERCPDCGLVYSMGASPETLDSLVPELRVYGNGESN